MKISLGNFGNQIAEPQRQAQVSGSDPTGQAVQQVGRVLGGIADELRVAEQQKQRAQAAVTLATMENGYLDTGVALDREIAEGKVKPEDVSSVYQTRIAELRKAHTQGINPESLQLIDSHLIKVDGRVQRSLQETALKRTRLDTEASISAAGEELIRKAQHDLPGAISNWSSMVEAVPHWDELKKQQAKQKFAETATYNSGNASLEGYANKGDIDGVRTVRSWIEGPEGEAIDPARRTALITKAYAYENGILAAGVRDAEKAKREQEARENKARDALKDARELMLNGRYMSTDYLAQLAEVTAGTSAAPAVQALVKSQAEVAGFASMPISQQAATIERLRAKGSTPGVGTDPEEQKLVDYMQRIHDGSAKAYAENPWQAAQERGVIKDAPVINLTNVQDAQAVLQNRMTQITQIEVAAGRKVSPLQPQEAETIGRLVRALPPDQQSSALASFGSMIGDADRVAAFARQIDAKDKVLGTAMMFANSKTTHGRYVSELILRGDRAIRDKSVTIDSARETGWRGQIAAEIGDAYPNQEVRERMIDAAYLVTAGMAAEGSADISRAVRMTAGEIVERNGSKIPLPYGMREGDFEKRISSINPADLAAQTLGGVVVIGKTAVPVEKFVSSLPDAALVHAGQGRYNVRAGMGLVTNQRGQRITIEVR